MTGDDHDLLRKYLAEGAEAAFTALVNRHVDLVYSAARRQVRSPDLAAEVTQSAFLALARQGGRIKPGTPLIAWLYLVTRRAAVDVIRRESRRQVREQTAFEIAAMKSPSAEWSHVEPLLDEAMESLPAADRGALLLRYFENKSLREVGEALGTSDDAAQKRVSRALEQLRTFFSRRGVTIGSAALASDLAAGAVSAAPAGLGFAISSAAVLTGAAQMTAIETARTLAMTTIQKTLLVTAVAAAVGAGLYQHSELASRDHRILELQQQVEQARAENRDLRAGRDRIAGQLADSRQENGPAPTGTTAESTGSDPIEAELKAVSARVTVLKEKMAEAPDQQIPEMRLLKGEDWINVAAKHRLETDDDLRAALREVRSTAKVNFSDEISRALWKYTQVNDGQVPADIMDLVSYLDAPDEGDMLARYGIMRTGKLREIPGSAMLIAEIATLGGSEDSTLYMSGPRTRAGEGDINIHGDSQNDISGPVLAAVADFIKAKEEQPLTEPAQLLPYLKTPVDMGRLQKFWSQTGLPNNLHSPRD
ncbi:MAG TPA: sigma-70 family RNA polymerase sigma factor [Opitutaceae bacterium]|nr:sigma-70 family RNA polymerase sigma factor [Opitutaceae bacterium]